MPNSSGRFYAFFDLNPSISSRMRVVAAGGLARFTLGLLLLASVAGCGANRYTINRRTAIPEQKTADGAKNGGGVAIHLDAQQRLVMAQAVGRYCAEPSPDALAAYAAAVGLGVGVPSQGNASASLAAQSAAASTGLRTQSITLMRDALYRVCEAFSNDALGPVQVATILGRSQDLTAVILAIEQLTGAVTANQVTLGGSADAAASSVLVANQQALDVARKDEQAKEAKLTEATKKRDESRKAVTNKRAEVAAAAEAHDASTSPSSATAGDEPKLQQALDARTQELRELEKALGAAEAEFATAQRQFEESRKLRQTIEDLRDTALTNATARTVTGGQFSTPVQRNELSKEATENISQAVQTMVLRVLDKKYTEDSCMYFLTNLPKDYSSWSDAMKINFERVQTLCSNLLSEGIAQGIRATFDETSSDLESAVDRDPDLEGKLREWLKQNNPNISVALLIYGKEFANLRNRAMKELNINP
jgi:hypothetical protein